MDLNSDKLDPDNSNNTKIDEEPDQEITKTFNFNITKKLVILMERTDVSKMISKSLGSDNLSSSDTTEPIIETNGESSEKIRQNEEDKHVSKTDSITDKRNADENTNDKCEMDSTKNAKDGEIAITEQSNENSGEMSENNEHAAVIDISDTEPELKKPESANLNESPQNTSSENITKMRKRTKTNENDEEEDVPGDFFDDFLKEDFMAGLDIVDEDDGEQEDKNKKDNSQSNKKALSMRQRSKIDHVLKFRESPPGRKEKSRRSLENPEEKSRDRKDSEHIEEMRRLNSEIHQMRKTKPKRPEKPKSNIDADDFDIRRDPEKTKRDIQRDKVKCAKDREQKIINEKLSIVETGLVPPGMEMEVDIDEVRRQERITKKISSTDLRNKIKPGRPKSIERKRRVSRSPLKVTIPSKHSSRHPRVVEMRSKTPTPTKKSANSAEPKKPTDPASFKRASITEKEARIPPKRSPRQASLSPHRSPKISRKTSPLRRSPLMRRSPRRSPRPGPKRISPRRSPRMGKRRSRSRSPVYYRRERSPLYRPPGRRDRSYSPKRRHRSRSRSFNRPVRREEKRSFLEELAEKLNETRLPPQILPPQQVLPQMLPQGPPMGNFNNMVPYQGHQPLPVPSQQQQMVMLSAPVLPSPVPVPVPVPAPFYQQQPPRQEEEYDQSFFIGEEVSPPIGRQMGPGGGPIGGFEMNMDHGMGVNFGGKNKEFGGEMVFRGEREMGNMVPPQKPVEISKLFQDKKIRLSEFLAITAKPEVHSSEPDKLHGKIKVIQRCNEAIKFLVSPNKRFEGRLIVRQTSTKPQHDQPEDTNKSPLLKDPIIQLPFTTPSQKPANSSHLSQFSNTLLKHIGVTRRPREDDVILVEDDPQPAEIQPNNSYDSSRLSIPFSPSPKLPLQMPVVVTPKVQTNTASIQTDPKLSECKYCEKRKGKKFINEGTQCGDPKMSFSVSTQCSEADFYNMIPKTQSLANLTPAQLLGRSSGSQMDAPRGYGGGTSLSSSLSNSLLSSLSGTLSSSFSSGFSSNLSSGSSGSMYGSNRDNMQFNSSSSRLGLSDYPGLRSNLPLSSGLRNNPMPLSSGLRSNLGPPGPPPPSGNRYGGYNYDDRY